MIQKPPVGEDLNTEVKMIVSELQNVSKDNRFPQQIQHYNELSHPISGRQDIIIFIYHDSSCRKLFLRTENEYFGKFLEWKMTLSQDSE